MTDHKRENRSRGGHFSLLGLLGTVLLVISLIGVYSGPDLLQYAFLLSQDSSNASATETESPSRVESSMEDDDSDSDIAREKPSSDTSSGSVSASREALSQYRKLTESSVWAGESITMTIHGQKSNVSASRESGGSSGDVRLILAGPRFWEVFPCEILEGNRLSDSEIGNGTPSAILDSRLAFILFGDLSPVGEKIQISGKEYSIVGVARHHRSLGASNELTAWVPLGADESLHPDLMVVSVPHAHAGDGFSTLWHSETKTIFGDGTFISFPREKTRASMFPRLLFFFFAVLLMKKWISLLRQWGTLFLADARLRLSRQYGFSLLGYFLLRILAALLLIAVTIAAMYALAVFVTTPLMVFPEWVPEKPVAMSSILARFWSLITENAAPVILVTEQAAVLRFWHFLVRLGTFVFTLGLVTLRRKRS